MKDPRITRLAIRGFRSLRDVELAPGEVTVLVGANGAGKSNLLSAIRLLPLIRTESLGRIVASAGGASALLHYGPKVTPELFLRVEFEYAEAGGAYEATLRYAAGDKLVFSYEFAESRSLKTRSSRPLRFPGTGVGNTETVLIGPSSRMPGAMTRAGPVVKGAKRCLEGISFFHFHDTSETSPVRQNSRQAGERYLWSDGSNLATYLWQLASSESREEQVAWHRIHGLVRRVAPFIKTLAPELVTPRAPETSAVRLFWTDERDRRFDVHDLSDGTLRAIALFTALAQPTSAVPSFVLLDEPELGLHPAAISLLCGLIRSVAAYKQIVIATQSPAVLDEFEPSQVVVVERPSAEALSRGAHAGETLLRRLDAAALEDWRKDFTMGQLWKKNVFGGGP